MVNIVKVEGFEAFQAKVAELASTGGDVFVMFSGSKVQETLIVLSVSCVGNLKLSIAGQQWCKLVSRLCNCRASREQVPGKG